MRILGVDPGSITTGFGVIDYERGRLALVEQGSITTKRGAELADRLCRIHEELVRASSRARARRGGDRVAVRGAQRQEPHPARACARRHPAGGAEARLEVFEYSPRTVKSAVVGYGGAEKEQVAKMVRLLMPGCAQRDDVADASDALAVAICHAHSARIPRGRRSRDEHFAPAGTRWSRDRIAAGALSRAPSAPSATATSGSSGSAPSPPPSAPSCRRWRRRGSSTR